MATVINNPNNDSSSGLGIGMIVGILLAIAALIMIFYFAFPGRITQNTQPSNNSEPNQTETDSGASNELNIDVPEQIDINVKE